MAVRMAAKNEGRLTGHSIIFLLSLWIPWSAVAKVSPGDLWGSRCSSCHGLDGHGDGPAAPLYSPRPRDLVKHTLRFGASIEAIALIIEKGIPGTGMPAFGDGISRAEILELAEVIRASNQAKVSIAPCRPPPSIIQMRKVEDGVPLWTEHGCIGCHGPKGRGQHIPGLQNPDGSLPDVYDLRGPLKGGDDLIQIYCSISQGRPGTVMRAHTALPARTRLALAALIHGWRQADEYVRPRPHPKDEVIYQVGLRSLGAPFLGAHETPEACGGCHKQVHQEWLGSRHREAMGGGVIGQYPLLSETAVDSCNRCHAPNQARLDSVHGITCIDCHVQRTPESDEERAADAGPHTLEPSLRILGNRLNSDICISCHNLPLGTGANGRPLLDTWREWAASGHLAAGRQCKDCHMKAGHFMPGAHDREQVGKALTVITHGPRRVDGRIILDMELTNSGAGHHFPTTVTPMATLLVEQSTGARAIPNTARLWTIGRRVSYIAGRWHELEDTRIPSGQTRRIQYRMKKAAAADGIVARLIFFPDWHYVGLLTHLAASAPLNSHHRDQLSKAAEAADNSAFEVFSRIVLLP